MLLSLGSIRHRLKARLRLGLRHWLNFSLRRPRWILVGVLGLALLGLFYTKDHLRINTYPGNMLSDALPWRQDKLALEKAFPVFKDSLILVIDAPTQDQALTAAGRLAERLREDSREIESVMAASELPFFRTSALLYLGLDELERQLNRLAALQPFLADLSRHWDLPGIFHLLNRALGENRIDSLQPAPLFDALATAINHHLEGVQRPLPWSTLLGPRAESATHSIVLEVVPRLEYSSLAPGRALIERIRGLSEVLGFESSGIRLKITGGAALAIDELDSASLGAQMASLGSFAGVSLVLYLGLRSLRLVLAVQGALILGLCFTALFAALTLGQLNLISVAFSVMYIGLGADYAIYLCLRYREFTEQASDPRTGLRRAVRHVGGSIGIGTLTTAAGFLCFVPTAYRGVAELGLISGAGMFISLAVTVLILPSLLTICPPPRPLGLIKASLAPFRWERLIQALGEIPTRRPVLVIVLASLAGLLSLALLSTARFDDNPLNLQDAHRESVLAFKELLDQDELSPWALSILAANEAEAMTIKEQLIGLDRVSAVVTAPDLIPEDQSLKLEMIDALALVLGPHWRPSAEDMSVDPQGPGALRALRETLAALAENAAKVGDGPSLPNATRLEDALIRLIAALESDPAEVRDSRIRAVFAQLVGGLPDQLNRLADGLQARAVTIDDLPEAIRNRWISPEGLWRVEVRPRDNLTDPKAREAFVSAVRSQAPRATGAPVLFLESGRAVVMAFLQAFGTALVVISVVLWLTLSRPWDVLLVLLPLLLASLMTGALMVLVGIPFNFANIIALPLIFGMGVDNCIHLVHRQRTTPPQGSLLVTSTALAVVLSAFTNLSGFGNLAVSPHQGMASMGVTLSLGILATLVSSLWVLPALLRLQEIFEGSGPVRAPADGRNAPPEDLP